MEGVNSNEKNEKNKLDSGYRPKVDICHYFGYAGNDIIETKLIGETINCNVKKIGMHVYHFYKNATEITKEDFLQAIKIKSGSKYKNYDFEDYLYD